MLDRDVRLEVAAAQREVVVVTTSAPVVSESPSVESTMVRDQIQTLPLNSRDFNQLVLLAAGAVENAYAGHDFGSVAVNGNRAYGNDYVIDGTPNTNPFVRSSATAISVDTIREFKVTSGVASAEYGQAGTQVSIVTRSGSNALHGGAFEYNRGNIVASQQSLRFRSDSAFRSQPVRRIFGRTHHAQPHLLLFQLRRQPAEPGQSDRRHHSARRVLERRFLGAVSAEHHGPRSCSPLDAHPFPATCFP